jgi:hypothetical protein
VQAYLAVAEPSNMLVEYDVVRRRVLNKHDLTPVLGLRPILTAITYNASGEILFLSGPAGEFQGTYSGNIRRTFSES